MNINIEVNPIDDDTIECLIRWGSYVARGLAKCHPDDDDMKNYYTGCDIATSRATIQLYRYRRDMLKSQLQALQQLYYSMNKSKRFNPKSYENVMLQRQISIIKLDLDTIKEMITTEQQNLKDYLSRKDEFYKKIRKNREKNNKANSD